MTVSIIIAVKTWQKNLEKCVAKCQELDTFEILVLPDETFAQGLLPGGKATVQIIPTGRLTPAHKRDIGLRYAKGEILAFIDDDAYPRKDWLKTALENFENENVAAVGGPALTPKEDSLRQKASGRVLQSFLVSAGYNYRYLAKSKKREVEDYPTCNFLVRRVIMQELGGFRTDFWPGEDTKLCLDITKKLHKKIIYDPAVLVWHHRRPLFGAHLKQVANYGLHRGFFAKIYPQTSLKFSYFVPTIFLFSVITGGALSLFSAIPAKIYFSGLFFYLFLVFIFSISKELSLFPLVFFGIILTHLSYGYYFLRGLLASSLPEIKARK